MKKIFTMITVCAATLAMYTASAGTPFQAVRSTLTYSHRSFAQGNSRSVTTLRYCHQLCPSSLDTPAVYWRLASTLLLDIASGSGA